MCIFVHNSVEIARFSPRKVQKRGFFAGGRGDFLAGQKRGFLGVRACRAGHVARRANSLGASLTEFVTLMIAANKKSRTYFFICIYKLIYNIFRLEVFFERIYSYRNGYITVIDIRS
jgi:hypothetical protein